MRYDSEIKARVPSPWLEALETEAQTEGLKVSDILRRAVRKHLGRKAAVPHRKAAAVVAGRTAAGRAAAVAPAAAASATTEA